MPSITSMMSAILLDAWMSPFVRRPGHDAPPRDAARRPSRRAGWPGAPCRPFCLTGGAELAHRAGRLLQGGGLLLGAGGQVVVAVGNLAARRWRSVAAAVAHGADDAEQVAVHLVQGREQLPGLVARAGFAVVAQAAFRHFLRHAHRAPQRAGDRPGHHDRADQRQGERDGAQATQQELAAPAVLRDLGAEPGRFLALVARPASRCWPLYAAICPALKPDRGRLQWRPASPAAFAVRSALRTSL